MPTWINVIPLELPGRGVRAGESFVEDFQGLVNMLCGEIVHVAHRRWAIFGHSMGALLAYGVTQRLRLAGKITPTILFASASPAPSARNPSLLPDPNNNTELIDDLVRQGGTPREVFDDPELLNLVLDNLRADYRVCKSFNHSPSAPLPLPIQVFAGRHDDIEPNRIEAWRETAGVSFELMWFDGGHFFIRENEKQILLVIEQRLRECIVRGHGVGFESA